MSVVTVGMRFFRGPHYVRDVATFAPGTRLAWTFRASAYICNNERSKAFDGH